MYVYNEFLNPVAGIVWYKSLLYRVFIAYVQQVLKTVFTERKNNRVISWRRDATFNAVDR